MSFFITIFLRGGIGGAGKRGGGGVVYISILVSVQNASIGKQKIGRFFITNLMTGSNSGYTRS